MPPESGGRPLRRRRSIRARSRCSRTCGGSVAADCPRPRAERIPRVSLRTTTRHLDITTARRYFSHNSHITILARSFLPATPFPSNPRDGDDRQQEEQHRRIPRGDPRPTPTDRAPLHGSRPWQWRRQCHRIGAPISDAIPGDEETYSRDVISPQYRSFAHILQSEEPLAEDALAARDN